MAAKSYEVGYKKPPKKTQFKKGNRANPKGRGKTKNLKTDLREELAEPITLHENGARLVISKQRAMIKTALAKALQGDMRAMGVITNLAVKLLEAELAEETNDLTTEDRGILEAYVRRRIAAEARKKKL